MPKQILSYDPQKNQELNSFSSVTSEISSSTATIPSSSSSSEKVSKGLFNKFERTVTKQQEKEKKELEAMKREKEKRRREKLRAEEETVISDITNVSSSFAEDSLPHIRALERHKEGDSLSDALSGPSVLPFTRNLSKNKTLSQSSMRFNPFNSQTNDPRKSVAGLARLIHGMLDKMEEEDLGHEPEAPMTLKDKQLSRKAQGTSSKPRPVSSDKLAKQQVKKTSSKKAPALRIESQGSISSAQLSKTMSLLPTTKDGSELHKHLTKTSTTELLERSSDRLLSKTINSSERKNKDGKVLESSSERKEMPFGGIKVPIGSAKKKKTKK